MSDNAADNSITCTGAEVRQSRLTRNNSASRAGPGSAPLSDAVAGRVPGLRRLPELTLDEVAHAQQCYHGLLGEQKECISNTFELRVLLGQLGLYPSEEEMAMVVQAARQRINFTAFTHYLRFCKREFEIAAVAPEGGAPEAATPAATASMAFGGGRQPMRESDTLRAFVALGGDEDGGGTVSTAILADAIRSFQLTIDLERMVGRVDPQDPSLLDYGEFCRLWASVPSEQLRRDSLSSFSRYGALHNLNGISPQAAASRGAAPGGSYRQLFGGAGTPRAGSRRGSFNAARMQSRAGGAATPAGAVGGGAQKPRTEARTPQPPAKPPARQPLCEDDRLQLLHIYLFPEKHEPAGRKARLAVLSPATVEGGGGGGGNGGGGNGDGGRLPPIRGGSSGKRRAGGTRRRPVSTRGRGRGRQAGDDADNGVFSLQKGGNGVYRPPSPMILFQRVRAARQPPKTGPNAAGRNRAAATMNGTMGGGFSTTSTMSGAAAGTLSPQGHNSSFAARKNETF